MDENKEMENNVKIDKEDEDNLANNSALAPQRVTKVLCVAVYDNK